MQKKIIALAIAGLASTAAFAQSNVTIYGRMDLGGVYRDGNSGGVNGLEGQYEIASGVASGSRIGFKGVEDLGNGLKAVFQSEFGIGIDQRAKPPVVKDANGDTVDVGGAIDTGTSATWTNRNSYVGLAGGFGTVVAGRLDGVRYGVFNTYDPFAGGTIGNFTQMTAQVDRADNAIAYISPNFSGFGLVLAYSSNIGGAENKANNGDAQLHTIMGTYDNGPISARLDYEEVVLTGQSERKTQVMTLAGSYDFGVVKLSALVDQIKAGTNAEPMKEQAWFIGAKAPIGKFTAKAMIGGVKDKIGNDNDSLKWALGVDYSLSKRTYVYANYGQIKNDDGATRQINWAANSQTAGYGTVGVDFGIAHSF